MDKRTYPWPASRTLGVTLLSRTTLAREAGQSAEFLALGRLAGPSMERSYQIGCQLNYHTQERSPLRHCVSCSTRIFKHPRKVAPSRWGQRMAVGTAPCRVIGVTESVAVLLSAQGSHENRPRGRQRCSQASSGVILSSWQQRGCSAPGPRA